MKPAYITALQLLLGLLVFTQYAHANIPDAINKQFAPATIEEKFLQIRAPDIAENGAVVPISITDFTLNQPGVHVTKISFFRSDKPGAPIATFKLSPQAAVKGISTRIKLPGTTTVYVVATLSDGRVVATHKLIKVTVGGCGGGGGSASYQGGTLWIRPMPTRSSQPRSTERYAHYNSNPLKQASRDPVSTFSIDVDSGAYSNVRRFINAGQLPTQDVVRTEEMINYFHFNYPLPKKRTAPFSITTELAPSPWDAQHYLLRVGLKGYEIQSRDLPPANLVFLLDVSGSMSAQNKLPLLKSALRMLSHKMRAKDRVSIVVYAGASGVVLQPVAGNQQASIEAALDNLSAGGSTNGGAGIQLAYKLARQSFVEGGNNRIILATDGDFNVGTVDFNTLLKMVKRQRQSGIALTTLGFGSGNYNDQLMEQLADAGNGNYAYITSAAHKEMELNA